MVDPSASGEYKSTARSLITIQVDGHDTTLLFMQPVNGKRASALIGPGTTMIASNGAAIDARSLYALQVGSNNGLARKNTLYIVFSLL